MRTLLNILENTENNAAGPKYATRDQIKHLRNELVKQLPYRFDVDAKPAVSPVVYIRVFGADINELKSYFAQWGLEALQPTPEQNILSGSYQKLSYLAGDTVYTLVVAGVGSNAKAKAPGTSTIPAQSVVVAKKEFTPTVLQLGGKVFNRDQLIKDTTAAVSQRAKDRPALLAILLELIDVAAGTKTSLSPENNANLNNAARKQLGQDFGEILAPIVLADSSEKIEFPAEGNFPLIDVTVGQNKYSVKSLTGSGTSFSSIVGLLDDFEKTISSDEEQKMLFDLIKQYHPTTGGKNTDKIIKAAIHAAVPEYTLAADLYGNGFDSYQYLTAVIGQNFNNDNSEAAYTKFLKKIYPISIAGGWGQAIGMPADAGKYLPNLNLPQLKGEAKTAGYPSYRANPVRAMANILTYILGVATLNYITKGVKAKEYQAMMTKIVSQSPAWLGKIDITADGQLSIVTKPFSQLNFGFQYHAPSHIPGNNLPGFMVVMDKAKKKGAVKETASRPRRDIDVSIPRQRRV
jgi:hypothetical protein